MKVDLLAAMRKKEKRKVMPRRLNKAVVYLLVINKQIKSNFVAIFLYT